MNFEHNLQKKIPTNQIVDVGGLAYVSWANMLKGAGMPAHSCVTFGGKPGLRIFDGVVVAVDMVTEVGDMQRIWLPVLDEENVAVSAKAAKGGTLSLIQSAIARCRAKAVSMVTGYGLSLYCGYVGDGASLYNEMGVSRENLDGALLESIEPLAASKGENGPEYLRWASALAAAKIRDPGFLWEVEFFDDNDGISRPYLTAGSGFFVAVKTHFNGTAHTEILAIMDVWSYEPIEAPTASDWNRCVMRALAKGIATHTGYGISLYMTDEPALKGFEPPSAEDLALLETALTANNRDVISLLNWLGVEGTDLSVLTKEQCERSLIASGAKKPEIVVNKAPAANGAAVAQVAAPVPVAIAGASNVITL